MRRPDSERSGAAERFGAARAAPPARVRGLRGLRAGAAGLLTAQVALTKGGFDRQMAAASGFTSSFSHFTWRRKQAAVAGLRKASGRLLNLEWC